MITNGRRSADNLDEQATLRRQMFASAAEQTTDVPLRVKRGEAQYFLSLPEFEGLLTETLIELARKRFRVHTSDRASAIAVCLSNKGAYKK